MKRLSYNVREIVNKLYNTIPLVPSNNIMQNIMQDIQYGLYDDCGDPEKNWDAWKERCIKLLQERNILSNQDKKTIINTKTGFTKKVKRLKNKLAKKIYLKDIISEDNLDSYGYNTDYGNRTFAISYINGKLFEGDVHKDTIEEYLQNNNYDPNEILNYSDGFVTENEQSEMDLPTAFASYIKGIDGNDYIAIYPGSLYNVGLDDVESSLKSKYPNAIICLDNNDRYAYSDDPNVFIETI